MEVLSELSTEDITFLRAVRDINANPEDFQATDRGEMPANKTSIQKATDLTSKQVEYRLTKRGLDSESEGGLNLILSYGPTLNKEVGSFGPKSAELTELGVKALTEWEESEIVSRGTSEDRTDENLRQLRARVEALEQQSPATNQDGVDDNVAEEIRQLREDVNQLQSTIEDSEWGGVDENRAEKLEKVIEAHMASTVAFKYVLGVDIHEIAGYEDEVPQEVIEELRESAYATLQDVED